MFKRVLLIIFISFFIFWCSSDNEEIVDTDWLVSVEQSGFSVGIPSSWEIIENTNDILPKPNTWNIELVVASSVSKNWFKNNLLILSQDLSTFTTSTDYSMLSNVWAEKDYLNYTLLDKVDFTFNDGEESLLYVFEAKYNYDSPKLKFLQTAYVCNQTKAYFMTIALPASIIDVSIYQELLKTFKCNKNGSNYDEF